MWTLRTAVVFSLPVVVVGAIIGPATAQAAGASRQGAGPPVCRAVNVTRNDAPTVDLQAAIDAAHRGDTLRVAGTCHGGFLIDKSLTLRGPDGRDRATLGGAHSERVVTILGTRSRHTNVKLHNLRIARGAVKAYGGGIRSSFADVTLVNTLVWKCHAGRGGGIYSRGKLTLVDSRSARNEAKDAGGIFARGRLDLVGHSRVESNAAGWSAGIYSFGPVTLRGRTRIRWNEAGGAAGIGIGNARLLMSGHASVVGNVSSGMGGGVFGDEGSVVQMVGQSSIRHNVAPGRGGGVFTLGSMTMFDRSHITGNASGTSGGGVMAYERLRLHDGAMIERNLAQRGGGVFLFGGQMTLSERSAVVQNRAGVVGGGVLLRTQDKPVIVVREHAAIAHNDPQNVVVRKRET